MTLELRGISKTVGGRVHIHATDLVLQPGSMNVLLGPTQAGKTTLMGRSSPTATIPRLAMRPTRSSCAAGH